MVNTFLTFTDVSRSAASLDRARLGKQRVEAQQILQALEDLRQVARLFGLADYPTGETPLTDRTVWISRVTSIFREHSNGLWIRNNRVYVIPKNQNPPHKPQTRSKLFISDGMVYEVQSKQVIWSGPLGTVVEPDDRLVGFGFKNHPAVRMWLGFEDALRHYIDIHIQEWIRRGYQNNMPFQYSGSGIPIYPSWATPDSKMILGCRQNLIWKEITRGEDFWYCLQDPFIEAWVYPQYITAFKQLLQQFPSRTGWVNYCPIATLLQFGPPGQPEYDWV